MKRLRVKLTCVLELPDEQANDLMLARLSEALVLGLRAQHIEAGLSIESRADYPWRKVEVLP